MLYIILATSLVLVTCWQLALRDNRGLLSTHLGLHRYRFGYVLAYLLGAVAVGLLAVAAWRALHQHAPYLEMPGVLLFAGSARAIHLRQRIGWPLAIASAMVSALVLIVCLDGAWAVATLPLAVGLLGLAGIMAAYARRRWHELSDDEWPMPRLPGPFTRLK